MVDYTGIPNLLEPEDNVASAGQPTVKQLKAAARSGLRRVINLRPASEDAGYDEASMAQSLDLDYQYLPVAGPGDLNEATARKLDALLSSVPATPTLIHCASGNRVGALMALRAAWLKGESPDAAVEIGRRWGLTKLEPVVRHLLTRS